MGSIKDIIDLIIKLRDSIQDRKVLSEILQLQSYIDALHSECLQAKERALDYKIQIAKLEEENLDIMKQLKILENAHADEISGLKMLHRAEMAGADDAHKSIIEEIEANHLREIAALTENVEEH
jgi:hypothetical protein